MISFRNRSLRLKDRRSTTSLSLIRRLDRRLVRSHFLFNFYLSDSSYPQIFNPPLPILRKRFRRFRTPSTSRFVRSRTIPSLPLRLRLYSLISRSWRRSCAISTSVFNTSTTNALGSLPRWRTPRYCSRGSRRSL